MSSGELHPGRVCRCRLLTPACFCLLRNRLLEFPFFPFSKLRPHVPFLENKVSGMKDPWARREAWRNDAFFSASKRARAIFPGFGLGLVAFGVYLAYDKWYWASGPGKKEVDEWAQWTEERNARLAKEHHHHH